MIWEKLGLNFYRPVGFKGWAMSLPLALRSTRLTIGGLVSNAVDLSGLVFDIYSPILGVRIQILKLDCFIYITQAAASCFYQNCTLQDQTLMTATNSPKEG